MIARVRASLCLSIGFALASPAFGAGVQTKITNSGPDRIDLELVVDNPAAAIASEMMHGARYSKLRIGSEIAPTDAVGLPDLPILRYLVAIDPSRAYDVQAKFYDKETFDGVLLAPIQPDHLETAEPAPFVMDYTVYGENVELGSNSAIVEPVGQIGPVTVVPVRVMPARYNPAAARLTIYHKIVITLQAKGNGTKVPGRFVVGQESLTSFQAEQITGLVANAKDVITRTAQRVSPTMLVVTSDALLGKARDLEALHPDTLVSYLTVGPTDTAVTTKAAIQERYNRSHFDSLLLFGDEQIIKLNYWSSTPGDWFYALLDGTDNYADVSLGRLPVSNAQEADVVLAKLARYAELQRNGQVNKNVLLLAHNEEYPNKYTANQEQIRTAPNPRGLMFTTQYGGAGATNTSALQEINRGYGIVAYRGHGSTTNWYNWDQSSTSFGPTQVGAMANIDQNLSVVFNIACDTGGIQNDTTSMAETLLFNAASAGAGAVAVLAATQPSYTEMNHVFNKNLFNALETQEDISLGNVVAMANNALVRDNGGTLPENVKMYVLYADPRLSPWIKE